MFASLNLSTTSPAGFTTEEDQSVIIIDNGSGMIKAGLTGDAPTAIFPSIVGTTRYQGVVIGKQSYVGDEAMAKRGILTLKNPIQSGVVVNWDDMENIWHHTFYNELRVSPKEHPVMITEAILNPIVNREKMTQIMFETFKVPKLHVSISGLLALYASGRTTGMIVDAGYGTIEMIPIQDGVCLLNATKMDVAGKKMDVCLQKLMLMKCYHFTTTAEMTIVQRIKEKLCYVAMDYDREIRKSEVTSQCAANYQLPDGQVITLDSERFEAPEILLFHPDSIRMEQKPFHLLMMDCITNYNDKLQKRLLSNIVLCGGITMLDGFAKRLEKEMKSMISKYMSVDIEAPPDRKYSVWIGGSILSSLSTFAEDMITKNEYDEHAASIVHKKCIQTKAVPLRSRNCNISYDKISRNMDDNKCNVCDVLTEKLKVVQVEKENIESLFDELLTNVNSIENENKILEEEYEKVRMNKTKLSELNNNIEDVNGALNEEYKQMRFEYNDLKVKYDDLIGNKQLDLANYLNWTSDDVIYWIIGLDDGLYKQYQEKLRNVFKNDNIDGSCLPHIDKNDIRDWGVTDFKHRTYILRHIQMLQNNEGDNKRVYKPYVIKSSEKGGAVLNVDINRNASDQQQQHDPYKQFMKSYDNEGGGGNVNNNHDIFSSVPMDNYKQKDVSNLSMHGKQIYV